MKVKVEQKSLGKITELTARYDGESWVYTIPYPEIDDKSMALSLSAIKHKIAEHLAEKITFELVKIEGKVKE